MNERGIDWRVISRGTLVTGFGIFLLLTTSGRIPWSFWFELLPFWPILLIALGMRLVFERTVRPLVLLSPALVLGTMAAVAAWGAEPIYGEWRPLSADRNEGAASWRLIGDLPMANVDIEARPLGDAARLVEGRAAVSRRRTPNARVYERGGETRVWLRSRRNNRIHLIGTRRETWELDLAPDLPLRVDLDVAGTSGTIDLRTTIVTRVDLDGAMSNLTLDLGPPTTTTRIDLEGAFHRLELNVPPQTPVYVETDGFLNTVDGRDVVPTGDVPAYRLRVDGAFNRVRIRSLAELDAPADQNI